MKEKTGWDMYYYGGARPARGDQEAGWYTFSHQPALREQLHRAPKSVRDPG